MFYKKNELEKREKFSIRKLAVGAASVMIGSVFFLNNGNVAHADELATGDASKKTEVVAHQSEAAKSGDDQAKDVATTKNDENTSEQSQGDPQEIKSEDERDHSDSTNELNVSERRQYTDSTEKTLKESKITDPSGSKNIKDKLKSEKKAVVGDHAKVIKKVHYVVIAPDNSDDASTHQNNSVPIPDGYKYVNTIPDETYDFYHKDNDGKYVKPAGGQGVYKNDQDATYHYDGANWLQDGGDYYSLQNGDRAYIGPIDFDMGFPVPDRILNPSNGSIYDRTEDPIKYENHDTTGVLTSDLNPSAGVSLAASNSADYYEHMGKYGAVKVDPSKMKPGQTYTYDVYVYYKKVPTEQKAQLKFYDVDKKKLLDPIVNHVGESGEDLDFGRQAQYDFNQLLQQGYEYSDAYDITGLLDPDLSQIYELSDREINLSNQSKVASWKFGKFDSDSNQDQVFVIFMHHGFKDIKDTKNVHEIINYVKEDGTPISTKKVDLSFSRSGLEDKVDPTERVMYSWEPDQDNSDFAVVSSPTVSGYMVKSVKSETTDYNDGHGNVRMITVDPDNIPDGTTYTIMVTYAEDPVTQFKNIVDKIREESTATRTVTFNLPGQEPKVVKQEVVFQRISNSAVQQEDNGLVHKANFSVELKGSLRDADGNSQVITSKDYHLEYNDGWDENSKAALEELKNFSWKNFKATVPAVPMENVKGYTAKVTSGTLNAMELAAGDEKLTVVDYTPISTPQPNPQPQPDPGKKDPKKPDPGKGKDPQPVPTPQPKPQTPTTPESQPASQPKEETTPTPTPEAPTNPTPVVAPKAPKKSQSKKVVNTKKVVKHETKANPRRHATPAPDTRQTTTPVKAVSVKKVQTRTVIHHSKAQLPRTGEKTNKAAMIGLGLVAAAGLLGVACELLKKRS